jgi:hypothetical protein
MVNSTKMSEFMLGIESPSYKLLSAALQQYHTALSTFGHAVDYPELFFQLFGCYEHDEEILSKTDFSRFDAAIPIINGFTQALVQMRVGADDRIYTQAVDEKPTFISSALQTMIHLLKSMVGNK